MKWSVNMSKKHPISTGIEKLGKHLYDFLITVFELNEWDQIVVRDSDWKPVEVLRNGNVFLQVMVTRDFQENFLVTMTLVPHEEAVLYMVKDLVVAIKSEGDDRFMSFQTLLDHYGKEKPNVRVHYESRPNGCTWEIRRPADLEALFRAYDNLALINRCQPIFNLPQ
jgi:hypothetical protein